MDNYCFICTKKLSLVEMTVNKCKCQHVFCKKHKENIQHNCSYNFFTANCNLLKDNLILIKNEKVVHL